MTLIFSSHRATLSLFCYLISFLFLSSLFSLPFSLPLSFLVLCPFHIYVSPSLCFSVLFGVSYLFVHPFLFLFPPYTLSQLNYLFKVYYLHPTPQIDWEWKCNFFDDFCFLWEQGVNPDNYSLTEVHLNQGGKTFLLTAANKVNKPCFLALLCYKEKLCLWVLRVTCLNGKWCWNLVSNSELSLLVATPWVLVQCQWNCFTNYM